MTLQYKQDNDRFYVCNDNNQEIAEMTFTRIGHGQVEGWLTLTGGPNRLMLKN